MPLSLRPFQAVPDSLNCKDGVAVRSHSFRVCMCSAGLAEGLRSRPSSRVLMDTAPVSVPSGVYRRWVSRGLLGLGPWKVLSSAGHGRWGVLCCRGRRRSLGCESRWGGPNWSVDWPSTCWLIVMVLRATCCVLSGFVLSSLQERCLPERLLRNLYVGKPLYSRRTPRLYTTTTYML